MITFAQFSAWWNGKSFHRETAGAALVWLGHVGLKAGAEKTTDNTQWLQVFTASALLIVGMWLSAYGLNKLDKIGVFGSKDETQNRGGK